MDIVFKNFNADHYATSLDVAGMSLTWTAQGNTHTLILRGKFDDPLALSDDRQLSGMLENALRDRFPDFLSDEVRIADGDRVVYACLLERDPVALFNCPISLTHVSYAVFACELGQDESTLCIYVPNAFCQYRCAVPAEVKAVIQPITRTRKEGGLFSRKTVTYVESYQLRIDIGSNVGYDGESLIYGFPGCAFQYPVTEGMLGRQLTVPAYTAPDGSQPQMILRSATEEEGYSITVTSQ